MICPLCKEEIEHAIRFMVIEEGVPHPITDGGQVDIAHHIPFDRTVRREYANETPWCECPRCGGVIVLEEISGDA